MGFFISKISEVAMALKSELLKAQMLLSGALLKLKVDMQSLKSGDWL